MKKENEEVVKYHKVIGSYIQMFNPTQCELEISTLFPMPENEEITGPLIFDDAHQRLVKSLKSIGQNIDVIVFPKDENTYWIIDKVRVMQAAKDAGFTQITCTILDVDYERAFEISQVLNSTSNRRRETYQMKAKRLEGLENHAKQYLKENAIDDSENSELTVRQYMATILGMSERYVSEFKAICHHEEKDRLLGEMDKGLMTMNKAAAIARNQLTKMPTPKSKIPLGKKPVLTCSDCPRKKEFMDMIENYEDDSEVTGEQLSEESCQESEVSND